MLSRDDLGLGLLTPAPHNVSRDVARVLENVKRRTKDIFPKTDYSHIHEQVPYNTSASPSAICFGVTCVLDGQSEAVNFE